MDFEKFLLAGVGIVTAFIGGWDMTLQVLLLLMAVDIITGVIKGIYQSDFNSRAFRQGLVSKAGFIVVIIICYQLDVLLGNHEPVIRTTCTIFYIAIEGSSIVENLGQMGIPIPKILTKRLTRLKEVTEEDEVADVKDAMAKIEAPAEEVTKETIPDKKE